MITSSTTLDISDNVYIVDPSGDITVTLPSITADGMQYKIKRTDNNSDRVTITGSQTIDGLASIQLFPQNSIEIQSLNNLWYTIDDDNTIPFFVGEPFDVTSSVTGIANTGNVHQFLLPNNITITKASVYISNLFTPDGAGSAGVYSIDGQTRYFTFSYSGSSSGLITSTISPSPVDLKAGMYYIYFLPPGGSDGYRYYCWSTSNFLNPTSEPILVGTIPSSPSTPPATFTPSSIVASANAIAVRFD